VVVFIHGSLDRSAGMSRLSRLAAVTHTTLRYDRRGYGRQRQHGGPFTVAGNVDDLEEILQGRTAVLVGHSYGGNIALAAAERLGEQIVGVSTYETPLAWSEWWPQNSAGGTALTLSDPSEAAEAFMIRMIGEGRWNHIDGTPRLAAMVKGDVVVIANAGHGAPISHPREFHQLLVQPHLVGNGTLMVTS